MPRGHGCSFGLSSVSLEWTKSRRVYSCSRGFSRSLLGIAGFFHARLGLLSAHRGLRVLSGSYAFIRERLDVAVFIQDRTRVSLEIAGFIRGFTRARKVVAGFIRDLVCSLCRLKGSPRSFMLAQCA